MHRSLSSSINPSRTVHSGRSPAARTARRPRMHGGAGGHRTDLAAPWQAQAQRLVRGHGRSGNRRKAKALRFPFIPFSPPIRIAAGARNISRREVARRPAEPVWFHFSRLLDWSRRPGGVGAERSATYGCRARACDQARRGTASRRVPGRGRRGRGFGPLRTMLPTWVDRFPLRR